MNDENLDLTHQIRDDIYKSTKNMSPKEFIDFIKSQSSKISFSSTAKLKNVSVREFLTKYSNKKKSA